MSDINPRDYNLTQATYSKKQSAEVIGVSTRTIDRMIEAGKLKTRYIGTKPLITATDLAAMLASTEVA